MQQCCQLQHRRPQLPAAMLILQAPQLYLVAAQHARGRQQQQQPPQPPLQLQQRPGCHPLLLQVKPAALRCRRLASQPALLLPLLA